MIDGQDQAIPLRRFRWKSVPEGKCIDWNGERVTGRLSYPGNVTFSRELARRRQGVWDVVDRFCGRDEHLMEWFFHFAPGLELDIHPGGHLVTVVQGGHSLLTVHVPDGGLRVEARDSWYSQQYGIKQSNQALYAQWRGALQGHDVQFRWQFEAMD
jgi:hypothetical protein